MTEADFIALIKDTLNIPVFEGSESMTFPGATIEVESLPVGLYGDGKTTVREASVTIGLWYETKNARDEAVPLLTAALEAIEGITSPDIDTYYDTTAKKFRAIYTIQYIPR